MASTPLTTNPAPIIRAAQSKKLTGVSSLCYIAFIRPAKKLVQIQFRLTPIAFYRAPKNLIPAFRTNIAGFFVLNPFFRAHFPPIRNSPQNNLFAHGHGKIFNVSTRKLGTLMAPGVPFLLGAGPDLTLTAVLQQVIRQAAPAANILYRKVFAVGKSAFAGNSTW